MLRRPREDFVSRGVIPRESLLGAWFVLCYVYWYSLRILVLGKLCIAVYYHLCFYMNICGSQSFNLSFLFIISHEYSSCLLRAAAEARHGKETWYSQAENAAETWQRGTCTTTYFRRLVLIWFVCLIHWNMCNY